MTEDEKCVAFLNLVVDLVVSIILMNLQFKEGMEVLYQTTVVTRPGDGIIPADQEGKWPARAKWRRYPAWILHDASRWLSFL